MDVSAALATGSAAAASLAHESHPFAGGPGPPLLDSHAAVSVSPSPSAQAQQADSESLPLAVQYAPSGAPLDVLRAAGFDGVA